MNTSLFAGNYQLARVVQLSLASGLSIGFYGDQREVKRVKAGISKITKVQPFLLADLQLEIHPAPSETIIGGDNMNYDFLEQKKVTPAEFCDEKQTTSTKALLKRAIEVMEFSVSDVELVIRIATFCATISEDSEVRIEHIAEAIQYRAGKRDIEEAQLKNEEGRLHAAYEAGKAGTSFEDFLSKLKN